METVFTISSGEDDDEGGPQAKRLKPNDPSGVPSPIKKTIEIKCAFINCKKSRRTDPTLKYYRFPGDEAIAKQWIINSGNLELLKLPNDLLRTKLVCSDHFTSENYSNKKWALKKGTIPRPNKAHEFDPKCLVRITSFGTSTHNQQPASTDNLDDVSTDEPEIKIEIIEDTNIKDPLQFDESPLVSPNKKNESSLQPVFLSSNLSKPIQKQPVATKNRSILRKVAKPPEDLLKQIKLQSVAPSNNAKLIPVKHVVAKKNIMKVAVAGSKDQSGTFSVTPNVPERKKDEVLIVGASSSEKDATKKSDIRNTASKYTDKVKKGNLCRVNGCTGSSPNYFKVDNDLKRITVWRFCLNDPKLEMDHLICDQHFIEEDMLCRPTDSNVGELKEFAVPSLRKVLVGCFISQCTNHNKNTLNMYPVPIWSNYSQWLPFMEDVKLRVGKLHDLQQYRVCQLHFDLNVPQKWYEMIPTLCLPSKEHYEGKLQSYLENRVQNANLPSITGTGNKEDEHDVCSYTGCKLDKEVTYIRFYSFPDEYDRALKWLEACSRSDILLRTRPEIENFIMNSIGVCFRHKNEVEKKIRRMEMNNRKDEGSKSVKPQPAVKICQEKAVVEKPAIEKDDPTLLKSPVENPIPISIDSSIPNEETSIPIADYCAFVNCTTFKKDRVKKYKFPADKELLARWIKASGVPKTLPEDTIRSLFVCGKHFHANQYNEMGTLVLSSVPEAFNGFSRGDPKEGNDHWAVKRRRYAMPKNPETTATVVPTQVEKCVVTHCPSTTLTNMLYPFPLSNITMFQKWVNAVENTTEFTSKSFGTYTKTLKICDRHFEKRYQVGSSLLRLDAVPTLHLVEEVPDEDEEIDTSIVWRESSSAITHPDIPDPRAAFVKGNAVLNENSIEFPNIKRELRFGKHCPKMGYFQKLPYTLYNLSKNSQASFGVHVASVNAGRRIQVHTAIIVDDDDQSEKEALETVSKIIMENNRLLPRRPRRSRAAAKPKNS